MKKRIITLLVIFGAGILNGVGQQKAASISFEKTQHDFGKIREEAGSASYSFVFTNTGSEPLVITQVIASCGCTSPDWTRQPVLPGAKGFVKATYDPANRPGKFNKSLTVMSNAAERQTTLWILGDVIEKVKTLEDLFPYKVGDIRMKSSHLAFVKVFKGQQKTLLMEIVNPSDKAVTVAFDKVPAHLILKGPSSLKPKEEGIIEATYNADKINDWGFVIDRVELILNGVAVSNAYLTVSASIEEDFTSLSPAQLASAPVADFVETTFDFGNLKQMETVEHEFIFRNTGKSDLVIRKVQSSCGCTAVMPGDNIIKPGATSAIKTVFSAGRLSGRQNKAITIITNDPKSPQIILRVTGNIEVTGT